MEYQQYLRRKHAPPPPQDLVSHVAALILKGEEVPSECLAGLDNLQRVVAARANAMMDIATVKRMNRLNRLLDAMDRTDRELTDSNRVSQLGFPELLELSEHLRIHAKELYDEGRTVPPITQSQPAVNVNVQQVSQPIAIPSDPRERSDLLSKVKRLLAAANGDDGKGKLRLEKAE
jgi:hypothetical protein